MNPLRCIIADDEPLALRLIESYVRKTDGLSLIGGYASAAEALGAIRNLRPDIAFLDIQMPQLSGIELARTAKDAGVRVVFITAYRDYAVEGFRVNALDYLLKPVSYDEFLEAANRARLAISPAPAESEQTHITVRSDHRLVRIGLDDIAYVEGLKDYVKIYAESRERPVLTQMSMKAVEQALPAKQFLRIHRSFIVNLGRITSIDRSQATLDQEKTIPIGETYRPAVFQKMGI